jgi:acyl-coenzyme A thioesterase PaaI-like protein
MHGYFAVHLLILDRARSISRVIKTHLFITGQVVSSSVTLEKKIDYLKHSKKNRVRAGL